MRLGMIVLGVAALSSCKASPAPDCRTAVKEGRQCMEQHASDGFGKTLLACFPFSKPESIKGAWVYGFERNQFYEGQRASLDLIQTSRSRVELEAHVILPNDGRLRVLQMEIIGRRSICEMGVMPNLIVADQVISHSVEAVLQ